MIRRINSIISVLLIVSTLIGCDQTDQAGPRKQEAVKKQVEVVAAEAEKKKTETAGWPAHISSAPKEWVSASRPLEISFSHAVRGENPLTTPLEGIVSVEPETPIKVFFSGDRNLTIEIEEALQRDVTYTFSISPAKLDGVETTLPPYQFSVQPFKQDVSLQIDGLKVDPGPGGNVITGLVETNDAVRNQDIERMLAANQENQPRTIDWAHLSDTEHHFTITGIVREELESAVGIQWDGTSIGVDKKGSQTVQIPALNTFIVTGSLGRQGADQYIEVSFSEPLKRSQSLRGLIEVNGNRPKNARVDGNKIRIYPEKALSGEVKLVVLPGIKSTKDSTTTSRYEKELTFLSQNPGIRFVGNSYIIPKQSNMIIPVGAVNVDTIQVTAYRIPEANLGQFIQSNDLYNTNLDSKTNVVQWRKTYTLPEIPKDKWQKYDLDLKLLADNFGSEIFALELKIDRSNIILDCGEKPAHNDEIEQADWATQNERDEPDWVSRYYNTRGYYSWQDRSNPCKDAYYGSYSSASTRVFRYFSSSNLGLIAKMAVDHTINTVVTDINTARPLKGVSVTAYNYQHQPVANGVSDKDGFVSFVPVAAPYYLVAEHKDNIGFLRLLRNEALSTNIFDVGGEKSTSGIKGFFYGERAVWRPGDDIYITFIVQDRTGLFPEDYPLTIDFFDPKGNKKDSITNASPLNGFYQFKLRTQEDSPTGNWRAVIRYGNQYFDRPIPVETIVPNRLKIELDFPSEVLTSESGALDIGLFSQWLNGAPADTLKADVKVLATSSVTRVSGFDAYIFDDPGRKLKSKSETVFEGHLDSVGRTRFNYLPYIKEAPGQVKLNFTTRVFEESGNFSTQYVSKAYIPYDRLVGINIPKGAGWNDSISRDDRHIIHFLSVDPSGNRVSGSKLEFSVYRIGWRWWWDYSSDDITSYISSRHADRVVDTALRTDENGNAQWELDGKDYEWGRYLFRICDTGSNHCAGKVVYLGWSYADSKNPSGDTQLVLTTDKKRYKVGETAYLTIPQVLPGDDDNSRFMLSLESGTRILSQRWVDEEIVDNKMAIQITDEMAPNIYAHLTLIQAYQDKANDSPVRLYGIAPILVDNPDNSLSPVINTADVVRPESQMSIKVSEEHGKAMTYTLAVVDEGLLGITNYKTPDPHQAFYRREALGVLTWDIYEMLSRAAAQPLHSLLTLGGSDRSDSEEGKQDKRRFPPVVRFIGPFYLQSGEEKTHTVQLPEYMGAVRVMIVAGDSSVRGREAYGSAEKTVTVTQPLTLLATLPRVLGPNENFSLPVSVFVNNDQIKKVRISVEANDLFEYNSEIPELMFDKPADKIVNLNFKTVNAIGNGTVTIKAESGAEQASQTVNIPVRSANQPRLVSDSAAVEPDDTQSLSITPNGMLNTNETYLEVSRIPDIQLQERLNYLIGYPHGCVEQTTSKLFPQIYLSSLMSLTDKQQEDTDYYVREGILKLQNFQNSAGAFTYWPNGDYYNNWSNTYAGHFLLEAKRLGYVVPVDMLDDWLKVQREAADNVGAEKGYESTDAYLLYTLALAGRPDFNAMNRLRETLAGRLRSKRNEDSNLRLARWLLAAAYAKSGVSDAAEELIAKSSNDILSYEWSGFTYGSSLRDAAILMLVYKELGNNTAAWETALKIAHDFNRENYLYSTQSTAWALNAFATFFDKNDKNQSHKLSYRINNGEWERTSIISAVFRHDIVNQNAQPVMLEIKNESSSTFYAMLGNRGIPANTEEIAESENISISVGFTDMNGDAISVDRLKQGTDFKAVVTVRNVNDWARLENLALTMTMPSGWQISNDRLEGKAMNKGLEYQDIRDDRVLSYFTLGRYYYYNRYAEKSITVEAILNASFRGRFYLPGWSVEAMYDNNIKANTVGQWVNVVNDIE